MNDSVWSTGSLPSVDDRFAISAGASSVWSVKTTTVKPLAVERWNVQKQQIAMDQQLMEHYEKSLGKCKESEHALNQRAEKLYNTIVSELKWSHPPIANVHSKLILGYCRHLITQGSFEPYPKEMDLRSWNVKLKGTLQEKTLNSVKQKYHRMFRIISRRDNMVASMHANLYLTSEKMKIKNEGSLRWLMERNHSKKDDYFSIWNLARINKLRELQVLVASSKMEEYGPDGINCVDPDFCLTPLHYAAKEAHFQIVQFLLSLDADVNLAAPDGRTPLHYAAAYANRDCVLALLGAGSIATAQDNNGNTPLNLAKQNRNEKTLPTLQHWEELMDFQSEETEIQILNEMMNRSTGSLPMPEGSQALPDREHKSTILHVDSVDKIPKMQRSFMFVDSTAMDNSSEMPQDSRLMFMSPSKPSQSLHFLPTESHFERIFSNHFTSSLVPWEYATVSPEDFTKMSRNLQFLVQRLNGFNPYLILRQRQLLQHQEMIKELQRSNPTYQESLYVSQTNWPAVTSASMQTPAFLWNSSMLSLPYNTSLHGQQQNQLQQSFVTTAFGIPSNHQQPSQEHVQTSDSFPLSIQQPSASNPEILMRSPLQTTMPNTLAQPEERIIFPHQSHSTDEKSHTSSIVFAGDAIYNPDAKFQYLTEIRLCTKFFAQAASEGFAAEAVRVLHRRWTVAKQLYALVANQQQYRSVAQSVADQANNRDLAVVEEDAVSQVTTEPTDLLPLSSPYEVSPAQSPMSALKMHSLSPKKTEDLNVRFAQDDVLTLQKNVSEQDLPAPSASQAESTSEQHSQMPSCPLVSEADVLPSNQVSAGREIIDTDTIIAKNVDNDKPSVNLERLAHDFLSTFTIIEYLPTTPPERDFDVASKRANLAAKDDSQTQHQENESQGAKPTELNTASSESIETAPKQHKVRQVTDKIFIESDAASTSTINSKKPWVDRLASQRVEEDGKLNDSSKEKPSEAIQRLLQRYTNEEHRIRLMEYAWRYENTELQDHYSVHSTTTAGSLPSSTLLADQRYQARMQNPYNYFGNNNANRFSSSLSSLPPLAADDMHSPSSLGSAPPLPSQSPLSDTHEKMSILAPFPLGLVSASSVARYQDEQRQRRYADLAMQPSVFNQTSSTLLGPSADVVDENSTIVSLTSWDLSINQYHQQHHPLAPATLSNSISSRSVNGLTGQSLLSRDGPSHHTLASAAEAAEVRHCENFALVLNLQFVEVLIVQREYDQALLCLEDALRLLKDGVLITLRIRALFQLCDLLLYLCDHCWQHAEDLQLQAQMEETTFKAVDTLNSSTSRERNEKVKNRLQRKDQSHNASKAKPNFSASMSLLEAAAFGMSQSTKGDVPRNSSRKIQSNNSVANRRTTTSAPDVHSTSAPTTARDPSFLNVALSHTTSQTYLTREQQEQWPQRIAAIEAQWMALRALNSETVPDIESCDLPPPVSNETATGSSIRFYSDPLYRRLLQRCAEAAQEAIDLGAVLSTRHVLEPLCIAQAMGYRGLAQERLGMSYQAWEMLEEASLLATRSAYASHTAIDLMLEAMRVYVKYMCRDSVTLGIVSQKAAEINAMVAVYAEPRRRLHPQADRWWRKSAELLAIATTTVKDPFHTLSALETHQVQVQRKPAKEIAQQKLRKIKYF